MQFSKLRLNGFKSFVDPTDLVISAGLTGVVGPNGCGKSNLLEALRWIMGENRARQMRGAGMDDVIFGGTDTRAVRNWATVELIIDNSERLAPAAFNDADTLEISRRITRELGSAYRINGKDVRARDVQMLFADASTGAHSPALVRQGQIAELINAKPKARRRILEEAAGISGLYQRRHEAELKLKGAETNLVRVDDLIEQLDQQLATLERQARQARRYREIADQLETAEGVFLYLRWKQAEDERGSAETALVAGTRASAEAEAASRETARVRETAEAGIGPLREAATVASAILQRQTIERERLDEAATRAQAEIDTLEARVRQLAIDIEREDSLGRDATATLDRLGTEQAALTARAEGQTDADRAARAEAEAAGEALSGEETALDRLTEEAARLAARAAATERRLEEAQATLARLDRDIETALASTEALRVEIDTAEHAVTATRTDAETARAGADAAEDRLLGAEQARAGAQTAEAEARAALSDAEGRLSALSAEVTALDRLLAREAGDGAKVIDSLTVTPGFEAALGAALGEDLNAEAGTHGSGWRALSPYEAAPALPVEAAPLGSEVTAPSLLARRLSQIGVVTDGATGARLQPDLKPGQRLVSRDGDLWRWDGFALAAEDAVSGAALRLQQRNRLTALQAAQTDAAAVRETAATAHDAARHALETANTADGEARAARKSADATVAETARALSRAEAALALTRGRHETQTEALAARREDRAGADTLLTEAEAARDALGDVDAARAAVETQRGVVDLARTAMLAARTRADDIRRAGAARARRLSEITRELAVWTDRAGNAGSRIEELSARAEETSAKRDAAIAAPEEIAARLGALGAELAKTEARLQSASDALTTAETAVRQAHAAASEAERMASSRREDRARLEAMLDAHTARTAEVAHQIETDHGLAPDALLAALDCDPDTLPPLDRAEAEAVKLRRQRDALGAVNLRAEEDAAAVQGERDTILAEKADLDQAIAKLRGGIAELNREGRVRLVEAFDKVNQRFARLFQHLFGGGEARLVMVESDDPLEAGLEILCQPPGKKLSTLSLLSGGEQTLTALSLIFAVFLANPAPVCVLDEVDAPLDDSNVTRFCDLLDEMRRVTGTRFLIITHHAITMSRMDRLFGVTMAERGVSQLVSVDLARASEMVDA